MKKDNELLKYVWGLYRVYAATSRKLKSQISTNRFWIIILTIMAAVFGVLCSQLPDWKIFSLSVFGIASTISFGLATYFSKEIIKSAREKKHVIARSAAEALKSVSYLFATGTAPYDNGNAHDLFLEKSKNIRRNTDDILLKSLTDEDKEKGLIQKPMSIETYIDERVAEQIRNFYYPSSQNNVRIINKWNRIIIICSIAGIILASIGTFGFSGITAAWVAVIGTITTAITSFLFAGRFSYLSLSYQKTAQLLEDHLAKWNISDGSDEAKSDFITSCENTISIENKAWMAELSKKSKAIIPNSPTNER